MKTKEIKKEVLKKLGIADERSISTIMLNDDLVDRIINEQPIWFSEALKKYEVSELYLNKLIRNGLICCFSNSNTKGSKKFIFENELLNYLPFYYHKSFIDIDNLKDVINIIDNLKDVINIAINYLDISERDKDIYLEHLKTGKRLDSVGSEFGITRERVRQIVDRTKRKLIRYANDFKEHDRISSELEKLKETHEFLTKEISKLTQQEELTKFDVDIDLNNIRIIDLDFSVRTINCLKAGGIETVYDLVQYPMKKILRFRNLGKKSQSEIIDYLDSNNIKYIK